MGTNDADKPSYTSDTIPPKLKKMYESAKKLAATRARLKLWQNTVWALTRTTTPTPPPKLPPGPEGFRN